MLPFRHLLLLYIFLHTITSLCAATFIVTSKNDNGPGTLRQAIFQANQNGTTSTDYIHFAIPGTTAADRTIILASNLPALTSNIVIDGTTQPGAPFGISNARVIILYNGHRPYDPLYGISISNAENVAIYGLYLKCALQLTGNEWTLGYGISISGAKNVRIGDVNKGNIVSGWTYGIFIGETPRSENIDIASNILGVAEDGVNTYFADYQYNNSYNLKTIQGTNVANLRIGGPQPVQGNLINAGYGAIILNTTLAAGNGYVEILNNKIGIDHTGYIPLRGAVNDPIISISGVDDDTENSRGGTDLKVTINNNLFATWGTTAAISCGYIDNDITIQGNKLGTDINGQLSSGSNFFTCISLTECTKGIIGGALPGQGNIVAYTAWGPGISIKNCENITISRNSTFCNSFGAGIVVDWSQNRPAPFVTINSIGTSHVGGTAQPHSTVELFYDDECPDCEGKTYFASVQADNNGAWIYNGPITGSILATATIPSGATSAYSRPLGNGDNVEVINYDCNRKGAIRGTKIISGTAFCWKNENDEVVGTDLDLENLEPGQYYMVISHGMDVTQGCQAGFGPYLIMDITPHILTEDMVINPSNCGRPDGAIYGLGFKGANLSFSWKDANGQEISTEKYAHNLKPGKYTITIKDPDTGCTDAAGPFEVPNQGSQPLIDANNINITATDCNNKGGNIKGLTVTGTGTLYYTWWNEDHVMVGTDKDLQNVPGGKYMLEVKDASACVTTFSDYFNIPAGGIPAEVTVTSSQVMQPKCGRKDGSIKNITVNSDYAFSYIWKDVNGQVIANTKELSGLDKGNYTLMLVNAEGCEKKVFSVQLYHTAPPTMDEHQVVVKNDRCNAGDGSITNIKVNGDAPFTYQWYNDVGNIVSTTPSLLKVPAGGYYLQATDRLGCNTESNRYNILNSNPIPAIPQVNEITIIRGTKATIQVNNPQPGSYHFFDASGILVEENETGTLTTPNISESTWFFINYANGDCISPKVKIPVKVINEVKVFVPTAFSPNGDNINDLFRVKAPGVDKLFFLKVYNRWGQEVFTTNNLSAGWDGTFNSKNQPGGSYIWILRGKDIFGNIINQSGSVLLIR